MTTDFSLDSYRSLIAAFADLGYDIVDYAAAEPARRHLVLRHDIDMSISAALALARCEADLGARATYFVLLRTEMYNPWSAAGRDDLLAIRDLGHDIGLHLDASLYPEDENGLEPAAVAECAVLEELIGAPVRTISFHRPVKHLQGRAGTIAGRRHAYEPTFFHDMGYCSDSRGQWHHGAPLDHPAVAEGRALQLLTHPIWWLGEAGAPQTRLQRFLKDRLKVLDEALAENCSIHRPGAAEADTD